MKTYITSVSYWSHIKAGFSNVNFMRCNGTVRSYMKLTSASTERVQRIMEKHQQGMGIYLSPTYTNIYVDIKDNMRTIEELMDAVNRINKDGSNSDIVRVTVGECVRVDVKGAYTGYIHSTEMFDRDHLDKLFTYLETL